ncbi:Repressor protein CI [Enterobacter cancerogenus]|nr:phage repressor protein CI [Enterobacter cancerogenus]CAD5354074.1 Repressor protein CI [Enterobacter cancerogenus]
MPNKKNTFRHINDDLKLSIMQNRGGQQLIERILAAYGFSSRQAFCNHLGISQSTMANRYARDTFPADWVVICNMETGVSIEWLASGNEPEYLETNSVSQPSTQGLTESADEDSLRPSDTLKPPTENTLDFNQGGRAAIQRLVQAYGFSTRQALADHLNVSKSTLAKRYLKDTFPSDWIIKCSLESRTSLSWLATGQGKISLNTCNDILSIKCVKMINGNLYDGSFCSLDKTLVPETNDKPLIIFDGIKSYLANQFSYNLTDDTWLVNIEGVYSIRQLTRVPIGRIVVKNNDYSFSCNIIGIDIVAKCTHLLLDKI